MGRTTRFSLGTLSNDVIRLALLTLLLAGIASAQMAPPRQFKAPDVKLIEAGQEPKKQLRYDTVLDAGQNDLENFDIEAGGWWFVDAVSGQATRVFPLIKTPVRAARGTSGFAVEFKTPSTIEMPDGGFADPGMSEVLKGMDGVAGYIPCDNRGAMLGLMIHPGPADEKYANNKREVEMRSAMGMEVARGLLTRLTVPFPVEPIGKKAKWDVRRYVIRGQIQYDEIVHFELVDFTKGIATVKMSFAGALLADGPYNPADLDLKVEGTGDAKVDLKRPLPVLWNDSVDLDVTLTRGAVGSKARQKGHLTTHEQIR
jgi:hypothetical protein